MPRFKSIIFYQYCPKIKLFLKKKCKIFKHWGLRPQTPVPPAAGGFAPRPPIASGGWGLCPQTPQHTAPSIPNFWQRAYHALPPVYNLKGFRSFCFEQFFLHRSVANLMMFTVDVCLMPNCFLFEEFYLHYALCDFDSILLHYPKLFIRQSIDREKIFNVTFENPPH